MPKDVIGVEDVQKLLNECIKVSARSITTAAKKGAKISYDYAKAKVPVSETGKGGKYPHEPGNLKRSIKMWKEKRKKGKAVYDIGPNKDGWYAHFQDSGFTAPDGRFIPGYRFLRDSIDLQRNTIQQTILKELANQLEKLR